MKRNSAQSFSDVSSFNSAKHSKPPRAKAGNMVRNIYGKKKNTREYFLNRMRSQTDKRGVEFFAHYLSDRPSVRVTFTSGGVQTVMVSVY